MLRARLATAAVAIPLLVGIIFFVPHGVFAAFVGAIAALGIVEYAGLLGAQRPSAHTPALLVGGLLTAAASVADGPGPWTAAGVAGATIAGLAIAAARADDCGRAVGDLGLALVGALWVGFLLPHFIWLRALPDGPGWVGFVVAVVMAGDSTGYFVGRAWGRHKLAPKLSPGKTVEGAAGILAGAVAGGCLARAVWLHSASWAEVALLGLAMGAVGQVGDLAESMIKRAFGAKDSGGIFPGHGGVLDRIDSMLFPAVLVFYYRMWTG